MPTKRVKKGGRLRAKNARSIRDTGRPNSSPKSEARDFYPHAKRFAKWAGSLLGIIGLSLILEIRAAAPYVHIDYFDADDPFRFPFVAENNTLLTFYRLRPDVTFWIPDKMASHENGGIFDFADIWSEVITEPTATDIPPGGRQDFYAAQTKVRPMSPPQYKHLEVAVSLGYEVLPVVRWHREKTLGYKMVIASDGTRHWIEDDAVVGKIPKRGHMPPPPQN